MQADLSIESLYSAPINIWVEDELTKEYLITVWKNDPRLKFLIAGGIEGVRSIIKDAEVNSFINVFGVVDSDFGDHNSQEWFNSNKTFRSFILPVHELENYLLDSYAIADSVYNNRKIDREEIEELMRKFAEAMKPRYACSKVIYDLKTQLRKDNLKYPNHKDCYDEQSAIDYITNSVWFNNTRNTALGFMPERINNRIQIEFQAADAKISDGTWRKYFPGKEIYRQIQSHIYDRNPAQKKPNKTELDIALANSIAQSQLDRDVVSQDLIQLLKAIISRLGLESNESRQ